LETNSIVTKSCRSDAIGTKANTTKAHMPL
jgi:hypothetical protein